MKKRYWIIPIAIFLLLPIFTFASGSEIWVECKASCPPGQNKCNPGGSGSPCCKEGEYLSSSAKNCCLIGPSYVWQSNNCCIDNDVDGYGNPGNTACSSGSATDC